MSCSRRCDCRTARSAICGHGARSGWDRPTSSPVRIAVSGLRSSCEASATNRRCRAAASSSRASMSFIVRARRPISSSVPGSGTRCDRSALVIAVTAPRICSTGRSARPTTSHTVPQASTSRNGTPMISSRANVWLTWLRR